MNDHERHSGFRLSPTGRGKSCGALPRLLVAFTLAICSHGLAGEQDATAPREMVLIPAGRYTPLFRGENEPNEVSVSPFLLDVYPVTNGEFLEFVRANPKWRRSEVKRKPSKRSKKR